MLSVCNPGYHKEGDTCTMCGIGSYKTDKGDEACTQRSDNDSQTTLANASISEASCGEYSVCVLSVRTKGLRTFRAKSPLP